MLWGLALSGGGVMGAAHLGVLRALEEWRLRPAVVAGASAGGLVAGTLAAGASLPAVLTAAADACRHPLDYFRPRLISLLAELLPHDPLPPADALLDPTAFVNLLVGLCPAPRRIEAWRLPAALTAVDLVGMRPIAFVHPGVGAGAPPSRGWIMRVAGDLHTALQATMAMPGVFAPVRTGGEFLVDGGVADNLPMDWAAALGARRVLAVDVAPMQPGLAKRPGTLWALTRVEAYFTHTLSDLRRPRVPILTLAPDTDGSSAFSFADFDRLVDTGYRAAVARRGEIEAFVGGGEPV